MLLSTFAEDVVRTISNRRSENTSKIQGGSLYHDDMIKKSPPENFAYVRSPPDFFLAFLLNIIIPRKSPPEEENALKNAPRKYAWRSQCPPEIEKAKKMPP